MGRVDDSVLPRRCLPDLRSSSLTDRARLRASLELGRSLAALCDEAAGTIRISTRSLMERLAELARGGRGTLSKLLMQYLAVEVRRAALVRSRRRMLAQLHLLKALLPLLVRIWIAVATHPDRCIYLLWMREFCVRYGDRAGPVWATSC